MPRVSADAFRVEVKKTESATIRRGWAACLLVAAFIGLVRAGDPPKATATKAEALVIHGHIVDAKGQPVANAKIDAYRWGVGGRWQANVVHSGEFTIEVSNEQRKQRNDWVRVVAVAPGFAPAIVDLPPQSANDVTIRLEEGAALEGQILTLEGKPIAGATVRVKSVTAFGPGDLDRQLKKIQAGGYRFDESGVKLLHILTEDYFWLIPELRAEFKTGRDGRIRIPGIGRDRMVDLELSGPSIPHMALIARTQSGPAVVGTSYVGGRTEILSSPFKYLTGPSRVLRGVVRAKANGKPVAGVNITCAATLDTAVTDAKGHFELSGCKKADSYDIVARPQADSLFFIADRRVSDSTGLEPISVDIDLMTGIPFTGKLLEKGTGKAVKGFITYSPFPGNPELNVKRDASGTLYWSPAPAGIPVKEDGTFSIPVAPGPGLVMAWGSDTEAYRKAHFDAKSAFPDQFDNLPEYLRDSPGAIFIPKEQGFTYYTAESYHEVIPIAVKPGSGPISRNIELTFATTVHVRFLDPDGKPVTGLITPTYTYYPWDKVPDEGLTLRGVNPAHPKKMMVLQAKRNLIGEVIVNGAESRTIDIRLQRAATIKGQFVDEKGKPIAGRNIIVSLERNKPKVTSEVYSLPETVMTDSQGRFTVAGLFPNRRHEIGVVLTIPATGLPAGETPRQFEMTPLTELKPGEKRDLGAVTLKEGAKVPPQ